MAKLGLALGSNLGDRAENLRAALGELAKLVTLGVASGLYETAPLYVLDQPAYLNMVVLADSDIAPLDLLHACKELEAQLGRTPSRRYGARCIDIDLLFYGDVVMNDPVLTLPHPRLQERRFVLVPFAEIDPFWSHPILGQNVAEMLTALPPQEDDVVNLFGRLEAPLSPMEKRLARS